MRSILEGSLPSEAQLVTRKLRLIWKHPVTRRYHEVGQFEALSDGRYAFGYVPSAAEIEGFSPLLQFPNLEHVYLSDVVPAFFANRIMSKQRPSYDHYLGWLGLGPDATPMEILARTGAPRATDTFHLVDAFEPRDGRCEGSFFVSGVRYKGFELASLHSGQELQLVDEPDNEHNPRAVLLAADGSALGWIPDWLVEDVHRFRSTDKLRIFVEQVNEDAPPHLSVLCRLIVESGV